MNADDKNNTDFWNEELSEYDSFYNQLKEFFISIRKKDDMVFQLLSKKLFELPALGEKTSYPKTCMILIAFLVRVNFIKCSIIDICEKDDNYSSKILFRSLIEHYFKFLYVYINAIKIKNDSFGDEYQFYLDYKERILLLKSLKKNAKIFEQYNKDINNFQLLCEVYPEYKALSENEMNRRTKQFEIDNIIEFLSSQGFQKDSAFLEAIIPKYSELSSYVHGGILAEKNLFYDSDYEKSINQIKEIVDLTLAIDIGTKSFVMMFFFIATKEKEFLFFSKRFQEIMKE
ncbi:MAG: hypothetical protein A2Y33_13175 [Spirochaetes bacterium GWF1_51_8]|nr:MAG: hypothetical protein A2Y33_13175 [Spirochaetes bacterium GWF1_51_8]